MIVPTTNAASPFAPTPTGPGDTNLLMALAEMHKQGRTKPKLPAPKPEEK